MPPRFAYWTIILDDGPTAFRARDRAELMGVFRQLSTRNPNAVMKWFSRGKLWDSPEQQRAAERAAQAPREKRGPDWRPGGKHEDPRARFDKRHAKRRQEDGRHRNDERRRDQRGAPARRFGRPRPRGAETPSGPERPTPPRPPDPEGPPRPGQEPPPEAPQPETIKILPEPPERATPARRKR